MGMPAKLAQAISYQAEVLFLDEVLARYGISEELPF
jgi:hypothetical protein